MLPVHKKSKMRKRTRRSHHALRPVHVVACTQCGQAKLPHTACPNCGHFSDRTRVHTGADEE